MKSQPSLGENFGRYMAFEVVSTSGRSLEQRNLPMVDLTQHHGLKNKADAYGQARAEVSVSGRSYFNFSSWHGIWVFGRIAFG